MCVCVCVCAWGCEYGFVYLSRTLDNIARP